MGISDYIDDYLVNLDINKSKRDWKSFNKNGYWRRSSIRQTIARRSIADQELEVFKKNQPGKYFLSLFTFHQSKFREIVTSQTNGITYGSDPYDDVHNAASHVRGIYSWILLKVWAVDNEEAAKSITNKFIEDREYPIVIPEYGNSVYFYTAYDYAIRYIDTIFENIIEDKTGESGEQWTECLDFTCLYKVDDYQ